MERGEKEHVEYGSHHAKTDDPIQPPAPEINCQRQKKDTASRQKKAIKITLVQDSVLNRRKN
jgi:hypothetical protein